MFFLLEFCSFPDVFARRHDGPRVEATHGVMRGSYVPASSWTQNGDFTLGVGRVWGTGK